MKTWETSMWLDRRETAPPPAAPPGRWARVLAAWRAFVFRMQLGPVGEERIG